MKHNKDIVFLLKKSSISLLLVLCFATPVLKASDTEKQFLLEAYPALYSDENYTIQGNIGINKVFDSDDNSKQFYARPSISYALDYNWALHGGMGFYFTDYEESENNIEIRPYLGISHFHPLTDKWKMSSYFRVEERFQDNDDDSTRLRFRLRTNYKMNPLSKDHSWHQFMLSLEGLKSYNHDDSNIDSVNTFDRESRVTLGIERSLSKRDKVRFELAWRYKTPPKDISTESVSTVYFRIQYYPIWGDRLVSRLINRDIDH